MIDEERAKEYHAQCDAEIHCDDAHFFFEKYMRAIGKAARLHKQTATNQVYRNIDHIVLHDYATIDFIDECTELTKRDPETGMPIPYASGHRSDESGESCYAWAVFNIADLPSNIDVDVDCKDPQWVGEEGDLAYELTGWAQHYRGPGRIFSSEPYYIKSRTRILVKQSRGLDI